MPKFINQIRNVDLSMTDFGGITTVECL